MDEGPLAPVDADQCGPSWSGPSQHPSRDLRHEAWFHNCTLLNLVKGKDVRAPLRLFVEAAKELAVRGVK